MWHYQKSILGQSDLHFGSILVSCLLYGLLWKLLAGMRAPCGGQKFNWSGLEPHSKVLLSVHLLLKKHMNIQWKGEWRQTATERKRLRVGGKDQKGFIISLPFCPQQSNTLRLTIHHSHHHHLFLFICHKNNRDLN